jgi:DNA polymerase III subunit delta'
MNWSVVGHQRVKHYFSKALKEGFSSHAYLLSGDEGIGKRSLVMDVIRAAHGGAEPGVTDPFSVLIGPDEKGTISIKDAIRPLQRTLSLRPPHGTSVFVLINDAERLSFDASHAVLKLLEEPPAHARFMLITATPGELPETVRSRCLSLRCTPPNMKEVIEYLSAHEISPEHQSALAELAGGSIGWLQSVLETNAIEKTISEAKKLDQVLKQGPAERLTWAKATADKDDVRQRVLPWLHAARARLVRQPEYARTARCLLELYETLGRGNMNARLAVEHFAISA